MPEIKPISLECFDEFLSILAEDNEAPLTDTEKSQLQDDFTKGRYLGWLLYSSGELAGLAVAIRSYSVVHVRSVLCLDELFIRAPFRGKGFGKMLFEHVAAYAKEAGYMRLEWRTKKDNAVAQGLYAQYKTDTDWVWYGMDL